MFAANNGSDFDFPDLNALPTTYVVASTPRSGSTLLCRALWATRHAGAPKEYFNPEHMRDFRARWGHLPLPEYLRHLYRHRSSPNAIFGVKAHFHQIDQLFLSQGFDLHEMLREPRYILISRRDRLRAAVSWVKAEQTGIWNSEAPRPAAVHYDHQAIVARMAKLEADDRAWRAYFRCRGIEPHAVDYEELTADYEATVRAVLDFLGASGEIAEIAPPRLKKLADDVSEDWIVRFQSEQGNSVVPVATG